MDDENRRAHRVQTIIAMALVALATWTLVTVRDTHEHVAVIDERQQSVLNRLKQNDQDQKRQDEQIEQLRRLLDRAMAYIQDLCRHNRFCAPDWKAPY